jgi:hypothetical protein
MFELKTLTSDCRAKEWKKASSENAENVCWQSHKKCADEPFTKKSMEKQKFFGMA